MRSLSYDHEQDHIADHQHHHVHSVPIQLLGPLPLPIVVGNPIGHHILLLRMAHHISGGSLEGPGLLWPKEVDLPTSALV
jgi:hypothetical protein